MALCYPALRSSYEEEEAELPKLEDLQGAAKGLMRLQDVYALQVTSLVKGRFQRVTNGESVDVYLPTVSIPLSGDDCFLVGKVHNPLLPLLLPPVVSERATGVNYCIYSTKCDQRSTQIKIY